MPRRHRFFGFKSGFNRGFKSGRYLKRVALRTDLNAVVQKHHVTQKAVVLFLICLHVSREERPELGAALDICYDHGRHLALSRGTLKVKQLEYRPSSTRLCRLIDTVNNSIFVYPRIIVNLYLSMRG
jgi:hypothetical protein